MASEVAGNQVRPVHRRVVELVVDEKAQIPGARMNIRIAAMGLVKNIWFGNAEIAAAKLIGREFTTYVANIAKYYYAAYRMIDDRHAAIEARVSPTALMRRSNAACK